MTRLRSRVRMELDQIIARLREAGWQKMAYNGRSITVKKDDQTPLFEIKQTSHGIELRPRAPITRAELVMAALVIFPEGAELHVRGSWLLRRDLRKAGFIVHNDNLSARIWNAGKRCDDRQAGKCSRHFSAFMVVGSFTAVIQLHCWHSASLRAMREASLSRFPEY